MSEYKRLTAKNPEKFGEWKKLGVTDWQIIERLAELEDEIESGLLIKIGYCKDCSHCVKTPEGLYCGYGDCGTLPNDKCCLFSKRKPKPKQGSKN